MKISKKSNRIDIEKLAHDLTKLAEDFDPYEFRDAYDTFDDGYNDVLKSLSSTEGVEGILYELDRIIDECKESYEMYPNDSDSKEYEVEATRLYNLVKSL